MPSWVPEKTPEKRQKSLCSIPYRDVLRDSHSQDAVAAAALALKDNAGLIRTVESRIRKRNLLGKVDSGEVILDILTGRSGNIDKALDKSLAGEEPDTSNPAIKSLKTGAKAGPDTVRHGTDIIIRTLEERNARLENDIKILSQKLSEQRNSVRLRIKRELGREADLVRAIADRNRIESQKQRKVSESYEMLLQLLSQGWMLAVYVESCDKSILIALDKKKMLEGRWLFIGADPKTSGIEMIKKAQGVFCTGKLKNPIKATGLTAIDYSNLEFYRMNDFVAVKIGIEAVEKAKKEQFASWLSEYKRRDV